MNEHIKKGNEALKCGDLETAKVEFYEALADPDEVTQRIAHNRLYELFPQTVYGSSVSKLYHRSECAAKKAIWFKHLVTFKDWQEAEFNGYTPCHMCTPPRVQPRKSQD